MSSKLNETSFVIRLKLEYKLITNHRREAISDELIKFEGLKSIPNVRPPSKI